MSHDSIHLRQSTLEFQEYFAQFYEILNLLYPMANVNNYIWLAGKLEQEEKYFCQYYKNHLQTVFESLQDRATLKSLAENITMMMQMVDRPNPTPISRDKKTLTFKARGVATIYARTHLKNR